MGKKKSVVLMTLLTIVILGLCILTAFPSFTIPFSGGIESWNSAVMQFDLGMDLNGGYYAYYYPEGVISETEYETNVSMMEEDKAKEYGADYVKHGTLYIHKDAEYGIVDEEGKIEPEFLETFNKAAEAISARYADKGLADFSVSVVDDIALRIQLPASETSKNYDAATQASQMFSSFAFTDNLTIKKGGEVIEELDADEATIADVLKEVKVKTRYEAAYLEFNFTDLGKDMIKAFVEENEKAIEDAEAKTEAGTETTPETTTLEFFLGEEEEAFMTVTHEMVNGSVVEYALAEDSDISYIETLAVVINSVIEYGDFDIKFVISNIRQFEAVAGENTLVWLYVVLFVVLVALVVFGIVKMGRFGIVGAYTSLSYLIITGLLFAFGSSGVFVVTIGSLAAFLFGLVLVNVLQYYIYNAIKKEFSLGKTVESSVKGGYKKTFWGIVDIYAVLLLGALFFLIGCGGFGAMASQLVICVLVAAFCNLLWARGINHVLLSASKDKYKYYRLVREDDEDDDE